MKNSSVLAMTEAVHLQLRQHLFPGDGLESATILVCSVAGTEKQRYCVRKALLIPYTDCRVRKKNRISWPGEWIEKAIDEAEMNNDALILLHSHPGGMYEFSKVDDKSDQSSIKAINEALDIGGGEHGSAVMTPDGAIIARLYQSDMSISHMLEPMVIGHNIQQITPKGLEYVLPFSSAMTERLKHQTACIVGVSGTGSIVAELLVRLGFGRIVLIEYDWVEKKNLNRILNSTIEDAVVGALKVEVAERAAFLHRTDIDVISCTEKIGSKAALELASSSDVIFSCVDSVEGRHHCDLIAQTCLIPLIDIGVTIPTRTTNAGELRIGDICGRIDYVFPGGSSLLDRAVVTPEALTREYLSASDPNALSQLVAEGYIKGTHQEAPSVISLNMKAASAGVNEWLARNFDFREEGNEQYARTLFSLAACEEDTFPEGDFTNSHKSKLGTGLAGLFREAGVVMA